MGLAMRPTKQQLLDRMLRRIPEPEHRGNQPQPQPADTLAAWVEVGQGTHPLVAHRFTIYDMICSR